jgi:hypothetical protein
MDWREDFDDGEKFRLYLRAMIDDGHFSGPLLGMAWKVIRSGVDSLTSGQAFIFKRDVIDAYPAICRLCQDEIPWDELFVAQTANDGYCGRCAYRLAKEWDALQTSGE